MASRQSLTLMSNGLGSGTAFEWRGGDGLLTAVATWGGGSLVLQIQDAAGNWVGLNHACTTTAISLTASGSAYFRAPIGMIRVVATTATAVYAYATGIPSE